MKLRDEGEVMKKLLIATLLLSSFAVFAAEEAAQLGESLANPGCPKTLQKDPADLNDLKHADVSSQQDIRTKSM